MTEFINFKELAAAAAGDNALVPKGKQQAIIDKVEVKKAQSGNTYFAVVFKIVGGPKNGATVNNNMVVTASNPKGLRYFFIKMAALGLDANFFAAGPSPDAVAQAMVGRTATIEIDHREYPKGSGIMNEDVNGITAPAGGPGAAPSISTGPSVPTPQAAPAAPSIPTPQEQPAPAAAAPEAAPAAAGPSLPPPNPF